MTISSTTLPVQLVDKHLFQTFKHPGRLRTMILVPLQAAMYQEILLTKKTRKRLSPTQMGRAWAHVEEEAGDTITFAYSGSGELSSLTPVPPISFGDTATYNLSTIQSAVQTLEHLEALAQSIARNRAYRWRQCVSCSERTRILAQSNKRPEAINFTHQRRLVRSRSVQYNQSLA